MCPHFLACPDHKIVSLGQCLIKAVVLVPMMRKLEDQTSMSFITQKRMQKK
jgi:hypothetical protein